MVYDDAPPGTSVIELPGQMLPLFTVIAGLAATVTDDTADVADIQPLVLVPVTE
jgi:hypothetical protein